MARENEQQLAQEFDAEKDLTSDSIIEVTRSSNIFWWTHVDTKMILSDQLCNHEKALFCILCAYSYEVSNAEFDAFSIETIKSLTGLHEYDIKTYLYDIVRQIEAGELESRGISDEMIERVKTFLTGKIVNGIYYPEVKDDEYLYIDYATPLIIRNDKKVIKDTSLSLTARLLFSIMCTYERDGDFTISAKVETFANELGRDIRTVQRSLSELEAKGIISRHLQRDEQGYSMPSKYSLIGDKAPCYTQQQESEVLLNGKNS